MWKENQNSLLESDRDGASSLSGRPAALPAPAHGAAPGEEACHHCGAPCPSSDYFHDEKAFCCQGCRTVYELLLENGLERFYDLERQPGPRVARAAGREQFRYLDDPSVAERLIDFSDGKACRVRFRIPAIHCLACVWLLENLFRFKPGIGQTRVNFPRKEVTVSFEPGRVGLSELVWLLHTLGYEPELNLGSLEEPKRPPVARRLYQQLGVAGFAFGNIMLLSFPGYLGIEGGEGSGPRAFFGYVSLLLALPVLFYSAADYWRTAWLGLRKRLLTIDLPIAVGMLALFAQSTGEILLGRGEGYLDSLTGLVFFLLCGKVFQQKTYERLAFDRDYRCFFPLSVVRKTPDGEEAVPISKVQSGDRLVLRHGELIPADSRLAAGQGWIDYSFVTGESDPVEKKTGDLLYAGGQQRGGMMEVEAIKPVSQSYLSSLWSHETFSRQRDETFQTLTNRFSRWFALVVVAVALAAAAYWAWTEPARSVRAFTAVLIVACPCALALAAPFALGTAQRLLARLDIFLRSPQVVESLAGVTNLVFDKTGTLTTPGEQALVFHGQPLSAEEEGRVQALARHSTHPYARRIASSGGTAAGGIEVEQFREVAGCGIEGVVEGRLVRLGSAAWLQSYGVRPAEVGAGPAVHLATEGAYRGWYGLTSRMRPEAGELLEELAGRHELSLLSGDSAREAERFRVIFGEGASVHFNQGPQEKLEFIHGLQRSGRRVMMVGDGLNDAGALRQSDVGVAVVEEIGTFCPSSDLIVAGRTVRRLPAVLALARGTVGVVKLSFVLSCLYNVAGIGFAARGMLSPLVCAILMPLSSITVVAFASGATLWLGRRLGLAGPGRAA